MSSRTRTYFLSITIIAILVFSAFGTRAAYADDGGTSDTPTAQASGCDNDEDSDQSACADESEEGATDPQATETATPAAVEATPAPESDSGADGETVSEPAPATDSTAESQPETTESEAPAVAETPPPADTSLLEQVPDNTTVTVLNADGEPQSLATQDAANAVATSDPIWCPAAQTSPTPGANGCTTSFTSFDSLLTELSGNPLYQGAGTIFVQQGAYTGGETVIDFNSSAYNLSNINGFDLTVQGGWNTTTNLVEFNTTSDLNVPLIIGASGNPWGGSITINNIVISNTSQTGLTVFAQGNVTINDSTFDRNREAGAIVRAGGNVAVANSSFSNPGSNRLQRVGLDITSGGSVSLFQVMANGNREVGANIIATDPLGRVTIGSSVFSGTKSLTTTTCPGSPSQFCGYGLLVNTPGAIELASVTANDNFLWGASLNAGKDIAIIDSIFNANTTASTQFIDDTGLIITNAVNVALSNVQADNNRLTGAVINATGTVNISNSSFSNNTGITTSAGGTPTYHGYGLQVTTPDSIFLNGVTASGNFLLGAHLEAGGEVAIAFSTFSNNTSAATTADQQGRGLEVISGGETSLFGVVLDGNQLFGANIQAGTNVFLDDMTVTNNGTDGVFVDAACTELATFTIPTSTYSGNGQYGVNLVNPALNQIGSITFANNGAGDINPAATAPCVPARATGTGAVVNPRSFTGGNGSGLQNVSFAPASAYGKSGLNNSSFSLGSLFANSNPLFGASVQLDGNIVKIGIFTGRYAYVYTDHGLQVVALYPVSLTDIAMGD